MISRALENEGVAIFIYAAGFCGCFCHCCVFCEIVWGFSKVRSWLWEVIVRK